jgi:hypothetical protein
VMPRPRPERASVRLRTRASRRAAPKT